MIEEMIFFDLANPHENYLHLHIHLCHEDMEMEIILEKELKKILMRIYQVHLEDMALQYELFFT